MTETAPGWYDDGTGAKRWWDGKNWTDNVQPATQEQSLNSAIDRIQAEAVSGAQPHVAGAGMNYVVLQVSLKEKFWGTGSGNLTELETAINRQAALGYRLHTISTSTSVSAGFGGGDRIQATMVFERIG